MASFKQKASDSSCGHRPLPFRSREDVNHQLSIIGHSSYWAPLNKGKERTSHLSSDKNALLMSPANKENVRSWLDSTSPTSVLNSRLNQQNDDLHPPTPSPVCSPFASSMVSSPYLSMEQVPASRRTSLAATNTRTGDKHLQSQPQSLVKNVEEVASTSRRQGKDMFNEPPPDSPTGSNFSSGSEGGLLALLASKLLAYKENGRRFSRYARESSGPIDEKHVMEDRSRKPPVEEIDTSHAAIHPQRQESDVNSPNRNGSLYRTASEAVSDISLGSANGRTLSMEFDAMLAAAVATGIHQVSNLEENRHEQLPEIQEDSSFRIARIGADQQHDASTRALVRVGDLQQAFSDDEASRLTRALTVMRQGRGSEDLDLNSTSSEMPASSSRSSISNGSRRDEEHNNMQLVLTTVAQAEPAELGGSSVARGNREPSLESSSCSSNGDNKLAVVLATHLSDAIESTSSSSSSSSICKEKNMIPSLPVPASKALEKVRRDRIFAQAVAYQDAKSSKCNNRYKREETKITAWENQQKIKAGMRMKKVEMRLEQKRAKALEKMHNEIADAHKRAEERKASAEAVRAAKTARVAQETQAIRRTGKVPSSAIHVGCFPF